MTEDRRPLEGVRVLDFTRVLAGPYATALMADLGADIIKVEGPGGDEYRHIGPFRDGESALFQTANRGKRSIVLDLRAPADLAVARDLAARADVLVENFRPGVMARLGLDAASLQAANPGLVYASISGFGQSGPLAERPAYDIIVQAMSGLMDMTGEPGAPPTMVGEAIADVAGGLFAAWGIMVALFDRSRTGRGRVVDLALFDALLSMMPSAGARVLVCDGEMPLPRRIDAEGRGQRMAVAGAHGIAVAVLNDKLFAAFCTVIGQPALAGDPRMASDESRRAHEPVLAQAIADWASGLSAAQAVAALTAAGVPASELSSARQAWRSEQAQARGLWSEVVHPAPGRISLPEQPVHFSGSPRGGRAGAPAQDEHGAAIRAELGMKP